MPLFGLALAPILVTQMLHLIPWHWVFTLVMIPGLIVGLLLHKVLRNTDAVVAAEHTITHDAATHRWTDIFKRRNVPLNILGMMCWLTVLVVLGAFLPNYLLDHMGLSLEQMGYVLSAIDHGVCPGKGSCRQLLASSSGSEKSSVGASRDSPVSSLITMAFSTHVGRVAAARVIRDRLRQSL